MPSPTLPGVTAAPPTGVTSVFTKHTVRLAVEDSATTVRVRRNSKQVFRPDAIQLEFVRTQPEVWAVQKAEVCGSVIKMDGSLGKVPARRDFAAEAGAMPWWLELLVEHHTPSELVEEAA